MDAGVSERERGKERFERKSSSISTAAHSGPASPLQPRTDGAARYSRARAGEELSVGTAGLAMRETAAPHGLVAAHYPNKETDMAALAAGLYAGAAQRAHNGGPGLTQWGLPQPHGLLGAATPAYAVNPGIAQEPFAYAATQQQYYYPSTVAARDPAAYYLDGNAGPLLKPTQSWGFADERGPLEMAGGTGGAPAGLGFAGCPAAVYESLVAPAPFLDPQQCFAEDPSFDLAALPRMTSEEITSQQTTALRYQQDAQSQVVAAYRKALDVIQQQQMQGLQYEEEVVQPARNATANADEKDKTTPAETPSMLARNKSAGSATPRASTANTPQSGKMAASEKTPHTSTSSKSQLSSAAGRKPPAGQADPAIRESHSREAARREAGKKKGRGTRKPTKSQQGELAGRVDRHGGSSPSRRSSSKRGQRRSDPSPRPEAGEYEGRSEADSEATLQRTAQETREYVTASEAQRYAISNKEMIDAYLKAQERALTQKQFIHQLPINKQMEYTGSAALPPCARVDPQQEMQRRNGVAPLPQPNGCIPLPFAMPAYAEQSYAEGSMDIGFQKNCNFDSFAGAASSPSALQHCAGNWAPQAYPYNGALDAYCGSVPAQALYPNPLLAAARTPTALPPTTAGGALYLGGGLSNGPRHGLAPPWGPDMPFAAPMATSGAFPSFRSIQPPGPVPSPPFHGPQELMAPMFPSLGAALQKHCIPGGATATTRMPSAMAHLAHSGAVAETASIRETRAPAAGKTKWFSFFGKGGNTSDEEQKRIDTNGLCEEGGRQRRGRSFLGCLTPPHAGMRSPFSLFGPSPVASAFGEPLAPAPQGMPPISSPPANPSG